MQIKRSSDGGTAPRCIRVGSKLSVFTIDKLVLDVQCQTKYYQRFLCFGHDQFVPGLKMTNLVPDQFALIILQVLSIYCVNFGLEHTVCPGSSDHLFTITILQGEYYSFTEQNNFRSDELNWIKQFDLTFRSGHYFLDIQYIHFLLFYLCTT